MLRIRGFLSAVACGNCRPQPGYAGPTGLIRGLGGVVPLPGSHNRTQGRTGPNLVSPFFLGALLLRKSHKLALQVVIHRLMDGTDGELQRPIPHLAGFHAHLGGFYVDELPFFKLADVFRNGVGPHARVLTDLPDAGPALVGFPVLAEHQVGVD